MDCPRISRKARRRGVFLRRYLVWWTLLGLAGLLAAGVVWRMTAEPPAPEVAGGGDANEGAAEIAAPLPPARPAARESAVRVPWQVPLVELPGEQRPELEGMIPRPEPLGGRQRWQAVTVAPPGGPPYLSWSPDGSHLACVTGSYVRLYAVASWRLVQLFPHRLSGIPFASAIAWSPDGQKLAVPVRGGVRIWNVDGTPDRSIQLVAWSRGRAPDNSYVRSVAWSPDGKLLAMGDLDGVAVWGMAEAMGNTRELETPDETLALAFSPDGNWLASGHTSGKVYLWNSRLGGEAEVIVEHERLVFSLAWDRQSQRLAAAGDPKIKIWKPGGAPAVELSSPGDARWIGWSPDGGQLAAVTGSGLWRWDTATWERHQLKLPFAYAQTWSSKWDRVIGTTGTWPFRTAVYSARGQLLEEVFTAVPDPTALASNPQDTRFAAGDAGGSVRIWEANGVGTSWQAHEGAIRDVAWLPENHGLATLADGVVRRWQASGQREPSTGDIQMPEIPGANRSVDSMAWCVRQGEPLGILASRARPGAGAVLYTDGQGLQTLDEVKPPVYDVVISPDGNQFATRFLGELQLRTIDGKLVTAIRGARLYAWTPGDGGLVTIDQQGVLSFWNADGTKASETSVPQQGQYQRWAWDRQGERFVLSTHSGEIWRKDGQRLGQLTHLSGSGSIPTAQHLDFAWTSDGTWIITTFSNRVNFWDAATGMLTRIGLHLPDGQAALFTVSGERIAATPGIDEQLVYVLEQEDGVLALMTPAEFDRYRAGVKR